MDKIFAVSKIVLSVMIAIMSMSACAANGNGKYRDANMDFGVVKSVAILPFSNLTKDQMAADRVRDVLATAVLATESVYVIPTGEVARGLGQAGVLNPAAPTSGEVVKLGSLVKVDAVITGVLKEYGDVRSGSATANVISLSLQMMETGTGRVVWAASATKGGITMKERLLGGGGDPLNNVTMEAVKDLINKLYD